MAEYRLDVRPFLDDVGGGSHVSDVFEFEQLIVGTETFTLREAARFDVTVSNAGDGIVAIGAVTAHVTATCSRCLCEFATDITGDVEGFWLRPGHVAPEDTDISGEVDGEGAIDLAPALVAALVVEAPFAPLHEEECAGLCSSCGADLNKGECSCVEPVSSDHPFAALQDLIREDENRDSD